MSVGPFFVGGGGGLSGLSLGALGARGRDRVRSAILGTLQMRSTGAINEAKKKGLTSREVRWTVKVQEDSGAISLPIS